MKMSGMMTTMAMEMRRQRFPVRTADARFMRMLNVVLSVATTSWTRISFPPTNPGGSSWEHCSFSMWFIGGSSGDVGFHFWPKLMAPATGGEKLMERINMHSIGVVHSPYHELKGTPIQGIFAEDVEAWVELKDQYVGGLKDLDGFSHAILLYHFHLSDREEIVAKPYLEDQEHGIFAIRGPHRPNHIGFSIVKITKIEGNRLYFADVDILDGTPVLDIKPYVKEFDSRPDAVSGWIERHFQDGKAPEQTKAS